MFIIGGGIVRVLRGFVIIVLLFKEFRLDRFKVEKEVVVLWINEVDIVEGFVIEIKGKGVVSLIKLFLLEFLVLLIFRG